MEIVRGLEGLRSLAAGGVLSIGNFDGVHRGHQEILRIGQELRGAGGILAVATFEPHPFTVLRPAAAPPRLTTAGMKAELLREQGVDVLVVLPPEPAVLNVTAEEFWALLRDEARPAHIVEGSDFNFGKGRGGTIQKLREWTEQSAVKLRIVPPVEVVLLDKSVAPVSSTLVRWLVANGRVRDAGVCLGRPYTLEGEVVKGYQRGRTIGFPTANLDCREQLVPADGVYAGRCAVDGVVYPAAVSIGTMPTFGENRRQVEAYFPGLEDRDLYGKVLRLELVDWVRDQRKFNGVEVLKGQLRRDVGEVVERCGVRGLAAEAKR